MVKRVTITTGSSIDDLKRVPDVSDIQREKRLCDLALTAVEKRMKDGTASSAEYVHFLRLGSERYKYEQEELRWKTELLRAKTRAIDEAEKSSLDYAKVIEALTHYGSTILASNEEDASDMI